MKTPNETGGMTMQLAFPFTAFRSPNLPISGKQERLVYESLLDGREKTFDDMRRYLAGCGMTARETSISARIRDLNRRLRPMGFVIRWRYVREGSTNTVYWLGEV